MLRWKVFFIFFIFGLVSLQLSDPLYQNISIWLVADFLSQKFEFEVYICY